MGPRHPPLTPRPILVLLLAVLLPAAAPGADRHPLWVSKAGGRSLTFPGDVAVDRRGVAFILDSGNASLVILSPKGEFIREVRGRGIWKDPTAVAVGPDGAVFIADGDQGRVLEVDLGGKVRREYAMGRNARATGVGVFGDSVYCVDNRNDEVVVFSRSGKKAGGWGRRGERPGEFHAPFRLAIDGAGRVFVTDVLNARVQWFTPFGQHLGTLKRFGAGRGKIIRPTGLAVDRLGRCWVGDSYSGLVQLFDDKGTLLRILESEGRPHLFGDPTGIAEAPGGLWVADQRDERAGLFR